MTVIGRVAELWRHPVKAMAPEKMHEAELSWYGISGDRCWALAMLVDRHDCRQKNQWVSSSNESTTA